MGSSASKAARTANTTVRKYPSRIPSQNPTTARPANAPSASFPPEASVGPSVHPQTHASSTRDEAITRDSQDPDLALNERLRQLGAVQPSPTMSNSSTFNTPKSTRSSEIPTFTSPQSSSHFQASASAPLQTIFPSAASNPAVTLLAARSRLAEEAEIEFDEVARKGKGAKGRTFLDVFTIRQVLMMRDEQGASDAEIEETLGLKAGIVRRLGGRRVVSGAGA